MASGEEQRRVSVTQKPWTLSCSGFAIPTFVRNWTMLFLWSPCNCTTSPYSWCCTTVPLHANSCATRQEPGTLLLTDSPSCTP